MIKKEARKLSEEIPLSYQEEQAMIAAFKRTMPELTIDWASFTFGWKAKKNYNLLKAKNQKRYQRQKEKDQVMVNMGLTKVKGAISGKTYWE